MKIQTHKQLRVDDELRGICQSIISKVKSDEDWLKIESDDMFQVGPYEGGYSGIEQEFWFSYIDPDSKEWWFGFSLPDAKRIAEGNLLYIDLIEPT